jgi:RimJ/RimL family protein N-acetyltransferase
MIEFNFDKELILEDDIVRLSPLKISDVGNLLEISEEPGIWDYSFVKGNGREKLTTYIEAALKSRANQTAYPFIVFDKRQNQYAGSTQFCEINLTLQATRLGYTWYGKNFQGTGLNKHCKYVLFDYAFSKIGFERIGMGAYAENVRSIAAMKSVGCQVEGMLRGMFPEENGSGRKDLILLSILKNEWLETEKEKLKTRLITYRISG